jgi:VWFA-related protein
MSLTLRVTPALLGLVACVFACPAQQTAQSNRIYLDVVVTPRSGAPVSGLQQQDFTVLDNKAPQTIATFDALGGPQAPVEVVLLIDAVNAPFQAVSYEREQIDKFLKADGGRLPHPISIGIFTDAGTKLQDTSSRDGNEVSAALDQETIGLREIRRDSGFFGAEDRLQLSLTAIQQLAAKEAARPGRKIILWVSPGWPILSGPDVSLDSKQTQQLYAEIVAMSTVLRRGGITLYSIDPLGASQGVGSQFYFEEFLKGVSKPNQALPGNLALQVLAVQSGGLALTGDNDISKLLERCMADVTSYYELSFDPPPGDRSSQYHQLDIKISKPGLTARTRTGYYAAP